LLRGRYIGVEESVLCDLLFLVGKLPVMMVVVVVTMVVVVVVTMVVVVVTMVVVVAIDMM